MIHAAAGSAGGEELLTLADPELEALFYPVRPGPQARVGLSEAELGNILGELKRRGVTRQLLYREYVAANGEAAMSYTSFCERIRQHSEALRLSMLLEHDPGAEMYIDYCGDRVPIYERSGEIASYAEIFVATLAASGSCGCDQPRFKATESLHSGESVGMAPELRGRGNRQLMAVGRLFLMAAKRELRRCRRNRSLFSLQAEDNKYLGTAGPGRRCVVRARGGGEGPRRSVP